MNYIGTGAIGGIVEYYVGAQKLLGVQSEEVVRPSTEDTPTENTPTENINTDSDVFEDFEDSQLDWQITDGERSNLTFTDESAQGSQALYLEDSSNRVIIRKGLEEVNQPQFLSYWFKYRSQRDNNFRVSPFGGNDQKLIEIREFGQTVHYKNAGGSGVTSRPIANINQDVWYRVELSNIDFESETLDIRVKDADGATINSATGVSFANGVDNVDYIRILNGLEARSGQPGAADPLWIDHIIVRP
jgi:hypothetical protein